MPRCAFWKNAPDESPAIARQWRRGYCTRGRGRMGRMQQCHAAIFGELCYRMTGSTLHSYCWRRRASGRGTSAQLCRLWAESLRSIGNPSILADAEQTRALVRRVRTGRDSECRRLYCRRSRRVRARPGHGHQCHGPARPRRRGAPARTPCSSTTPPITSSTERSRSRGLRPMSRTR